MGPEGPENLRITQEERAGPKIGIPRNSRRRAQTVAGGGVTTNPDCILHISFLSSESAALSRLEHDVASIEFRSNSAFPRSAERARRVRETRMFSPAGRRADPDDTTTRGPSATPAPRPDLTGPPPARLTGTGGLTAPHLLALQRGAGNAAVAASLAAASGPTVVQRVLSAEKLEEQQYTGVFGNTGREQYTAVIDKVREYHVLVAKGTSTREVLTEIHDAIKSWRTATNGLTGEKLNRRRLLIDELEKEVAQETDLPRQAERIHRECEAAMNQIARGVATRSIPPAELRELQHRFAERGNAAASWLNPAARTGTSLPPISRLAEEHAADKKVLNRALLKKMAAVSSRAMKKIISSEHFEYRHNREVGDRRLYRMPAETWTPENPDPEHTGASRVLSFNSKGSAATAVRNLFKEKDKAVVIECGAAASLCYFRAILYAVGRAAFDKMFEQINITNGLSGELEAYLTTVVITDSSEIQKGDWVYFLNHLNYPQLHDGGAFVGENAIAVGPNQYAGFGVDPVSELKMLRTLAKAMFRLERVSHPERDPRHEINVKRLQLFLTSFPLDPTAAEDEVALLDHEKKLRARGEYNNLVDRRNENLRTLLKGYTDAARLADDFDIPGLGKRVEETRPTGAVATATRTVDRLDFDVITLIASPPAAAQSEEEEKEKEKEDRPHARRNLLRGG